MPVYAVKCEKCGCSGDQVHKMSDEHSPCAACGGKVGIDYTRQKTRSERRFAGSEAVSLQFGFHPDEVAEARREFEGTGADIKDDGEVHFESRGVERKFRKKWESMKRAAGT